MKSPWVCPCLAEAAVVHQSDRSSLCRRVKGRCRCLSKRSQGERYINTGNYFDMMAVKGDCDLN